MNISEIVKQKIHDEGPISFHDLMNMALYYPLHGYYNSDRNKIGKSGDYYTAAFCSDLLGKAISTQLKEMWKILGTETFTIVEYGAGTGLLCYDILAYFKESPELYSRLNYCIIEKSPAMIDRQKKILSEKVYWYDSISEIPLNISCIFSNELIDNLPVHKVVMQKELMEVFVDFKEGFAELLKPASAEICSYIRELNITLPNGYSTEINLAALEWLKEIAGSLNQGFVLTIDYGFSTSELYAGNRSNGTLVCYANHTVNENFYNDIGDQDITAHVNFSALRYWGKKTGLDYSGYTNQAYFMIALGLSDYLQKTKKLDHCNEEEKIFFLHNFLLGMGRKFKVLIQQKGIRSTQLSGLKFLLQLE